MLNRSDQDQPGLEVNLNHDGMYTLYPATNDKLEHVDSDTEASKVTVARSSWHYPWGLRPLWFGILIAIVTTIAVGAIVGGAVGGAMAHSKGSSGYDRNPVPLSTESRQLY